MIAYSSLRALTIWNLAAIIYPINHHNIISKAYAISLLDFKVPDTLILLQRL
jgi:hypothetical protein